MVLQQRKYSIIIVNPLFRRLLSLYLFPFRERERILTAPFAGKMAAQALPSTHPCSIDACRIFFIINVQQEGRMEKEMEKQWGEAISCPAACC